MIHLAVRIVVKSEKSKSVSDTEIRPSQCLCVVKDNALVSGQFDYSKRL